LRKATKNKNEKNVIEKTEEKKPAEKAETGEVNVSEKIDKTKERFDFDIEDATDYLKKRYKTPAKR